MTIFVFTASSPSISPLFSLTLPPPFKFSLSFHSSFSLPNLPGWTMTKTEEGWVEGPLKPCRDKAWLLWTHLPAPHDSHMIITLHFPLITGLHHCSTQTCGKTQQPDNSVVMSIHQREVKKCSYSGGVLFSAHGQQLHSEGFWS